MKGLLVDLGFLALAIAVFLGILHFYEVNNMTALAGVCVAALIVSFLYSLLKDRLGKKAVK